jgi:phosphotransferase system HPr (HPr) family protein
MPEMGEQDLNPAELKAIEDHKYFMSKEQKREVTIEEAIADFLKNYQDNWESRRTKEDNLEQADEIKKHKYLKSQEKGYDVGDEAVEEWRQKYAPIWRAERESLEKNGFQSVKVVIQNKKGLHVRPCGTLVTIAKKFDCDLYVHKAGMEIYNFKINGKPYMNVRSVLASLNLLTLCAAMHDEIEFMAYGRHAGEALKEIETLVNNRFEETT